MNQDLPAFVVMLSRGRTDQPLYDRLWGSGFLPTRYQGVKLRGGKEPVLYLANPAGCSPQLRRQMLDDLGELNQLRHAETGDPEILTRVAQYELAYRMQSSVPELTDLSREPRSVLELYGPDVRKTGKLRRQLPPCQATGRARGAVHPALSHGVGPAQRTSLHRSALQCRDTDQPSAALDSRPEAARLARRHAGDLGRGVRQDHLLARPAHRDRLRPRPSSPLLHDLDGRRWDQAGPDPRPDRRFLIQHHRDPVEVYDLNATILHLLGIDHLRLTYKFQGRDFRLTDVHGRVVKEILA